MRAPFPASVYLHPAPYPNAYPNQPQNALIYADVRDRVLAL
jgi:hypothetical protein